MGFGKVTDGLTVAGDEGHRLALHRAGCYLGKEVAQTRVKSGGLPQGEFVGGGFEHFRFEFRRIRHGIELQDFQSLFAVRRGKQHPGHVDPIGRGSGDHPEHLTVLVARIPGQ